MELEKYNIHMGKIMKSETVTFYVNHEERLSESDADIVSIINQKEMATVDNVELRNNQVILSGSIAYGLLYYTNDSDKANGIEGEIPFEEAIKISGIDDSCSISAKIVVSSATVKLIDQRSFIYKIQLTAYLNGECMEDIQAAVHAERDNMMTRYGQMDSLAIVADKTDTFRISEQIIIPYNKQPIGKIVWKDVRIKNINTKMLEGVIHISGELQVFIMYIPEEESAPQQWIDTTLNFGGTLEISEAREDLISYITTNLYNITIDAEMDQDNEMRELRINALLKLNIKIYEEKQIDILEDVYAPDANLIPVMEEKTFERLLVKNASRTKNNIKINVDQSKGHILQICNSMAEVKIENITVSDNGLKAVGKIRVCVMYISSDDTHPVCCQWKEEEFEHRIDAEGISEKDKYYIDWQVEQVNANMLSTDEIEVKAAIVLEIIVFKEEKREFISRIDEEEIDMEKVNAAPVIKGYVVQPGDTLWKLAKENYTTIENIMAMNELQSEHIKKGDRLLIMKSCM